MHRSHETLVSSRCKRRKRVTRSPVLPREKGPGWCRRRLVAMRYNAGRRVAGLQPVPQWSICPLGTNHPLYFHLSGSGMGAGHVGNNVKNVSPEAACCALVAPRAELRKPVATNRLGFALAGPGHLWKQRVPQNGSGVSRNRYGPENGSGGGNCVGGCLGWGVWHKQVLRVTGHSRFGCPASVGMASGEHATGNPDPMSHHNH